jgi:DNA-binding IclR family transcriptional regulator
LKPSHQVFHLPRQSHEDRSITCVALPLFDTLVQAKDYQTTREIALAIRYSTKTVHRALEDLAVHRVVMHTTQKGKKGDVWTCTPETMQLYADTPETLNLIDFD